MKYRKPVPAHPIVEQKSRFPNTSRLSPQMIVLNYFVIGTLIAVTLFGGSFLLWHRVAAWRAVDVRDAPTQNGTAVIETISSRHLGNYPNRIRARIGFRINGHLATVDTAAAAEYDSVHIGERVAVHYRVGKSGDIYIDDWQGPLH